VKKAILKHVYGSKHNNNISVSKVMKRKLNDDGKQIHQYNVSTKRTTTSDIWPHIIEHNPLHDICQWNPGPGFAQVNIYGVNKPIKEIHVHSLPYPALLVNKICIDNTETIRTTVQTNVF